MEKEKAILILEDWVSNRFMEHSKFQLPIVDEVVINYNDENEIKQYTFKGLIKIAYDL
jgi:hypothetical protein